MPSRLGALGATLAGAIVIVAPVSPASADQGVCVGQGDAVTGPLYYPGFGPTSPEILPTMDTVGYAFLLGPALCTYVNPIGISTTVPGAGTLTGWCGESTGVGTAGGHHHYFHMTVGSFFVLEPRFSGSNDPHATGLLNMVPDATASQSCVSGATRFIVTGVLVLM